MCWAKLTRSRWKKRLLFILVLLFLPIMSVQAEDRPLTWQVQRVTFQPDGYVTIGNDLYGWESTYGAVYRLNLVDGEAVEINAARPKYLISDDDDPTYGRYTVSVWRDQLVALDWQEQSVLAVTEDEVTPIARLRLPDTSATCTSPTFVGDKLYLLSGTTLYCQDMTSGARAQRVATGIQHMAPWTGDAVLGTCYTTENNTEVWIIDAQGTRETLTEMEGPVQALMASPEEEAFWGISRGILYAWHDGVTTRLRTVPANQLRSMTTVLLGDQCLLRSSEGDSLIDLKATNQTFLRIEGYAEDISDAGFGEAHPEIGVEHVWNYTINAESLYTDLLLGNAQADLYFLPYSGSVKKLMEKGYAFTLPHSEVLLADAARMWPQYSACVLQNGELQAMIAYVYTGAWSEQFTEARNDHTLSSWFPTTLQEALTLLSDWEDHEANVGQLFLGTDAYLGSRAWTALDWLDAGLTQVMLARNQEERLDLQNNVALRQLMEEVKAAYAMSGLPLLPEDAPAGGDLPAAVRGMTGDGFCGINLNNYFSMRGVGMTSQVYAAAPQLFAEEPMRYPAVLMIYLLNPRSEHQAEAVAYLEWLAENRGASWEALLFPDAQPTLSDSALRQLAENQERQGELQQQLQAIEEQGKAGSLDQETLERKTRLENSLISLAERRQMLKEDAPSYAVWAPNLTFYRETMLPNLVVVDDPLLERGSTATLPVYDQLLALCTRYLTCVQSVDQTLREMQRILDTWWMENQ